jgi:hypothetical protein
MYIVMYSTVVFLRFKGEVACMRYIYFTKESYLRIENFNLLVYFEIIATVFSVLEEYA